MSDETVSQVLADLAAFRKSGVAEFTRQRISLVGAIASGKSVDPRSLDQILKSSQCSEEQFVKEVEHASALHAQRLAKIEAAEIEKKSEPLYAALSKAESDFAAAQKAYETKKEELEHKLHWLREPLKAHTLVAGRVRDTLPEIPLSVQQLGWGAEIQQLAGESHRLANPTGEPGPDSSEEARKAWQAEDQRRLERLAFVQRRTAVLTRAWHLVQEKMRDEATGIWDQFSDPSRFLAIAEQELAAK